MIQIYNRYLKKVFGASTFYCVRSMSSRCSDHDVKRRKTDDQTVYILSIYYSPDRQKNAYFALCRFFTDIYIYKVFFALCSRLFWLRMNRLNIYNRINRHKRI